MHEVCLIVIAAIPVPFSSKPNFMHSGLVSSFIKLYPTKTISYLGALLSTPASVQPLVSKLHLSIAWSNNYTVDLRKKKFSFIGKATCNMHELYKPPHKNGRKFDTH